jgi:hypothetical protein
LRSEQYLVLFTTLTCHGACWPAVISFSDVILLQERRDNRRVALLARGVADDGGDEESGSRSQ